MAVPLDSKTALFLLMVLTLGYRDLILFQSGSPSGAAPRGPNQGGRDGRRFLLNSALVTGHTSFEISGGRVQRANGCAGKVGSPY